MQSAIFVNFSANDFLYARRMSSTFFEAKLAPRIVWPQSINSCSLFLPGKKLIR
jgi:hypothetical protein